MSRTRSKRLVNKQVQLGLIGCFITISALCAMFQIVLLNRSLGRLAQELGEPEALLDALPALLRNNLLITVGTLLPAMWVFGLLITHRLAGPIHRFQAYFDQLARGEYEGPCTVRDGDELQELCASINGAVERLRADGELRSRDRRQAA